MWLNAQGNSNHCLYYSTAALNAARAGTFPLDGNANMRGFRTKWSPFAYGNEMIAAHTPNPIQIWVATVWAAAIARLHGWTGQETHGHGEVAADRGWGDPNIDMGQHRRDVMALVRQSHLILVPGIPERTPTDQPPEEDIMASLQQMREAFREELNAALPYGNKKINQLVDSTAPLRGALGLYGNAKLNQIIVMLRGVATKSDVDIDHEAIAQVLADSLSPIIVDAVTAALGKVEVDEAVATQLRDEIFAELSQRVQTPADPVDDNLGELA
ncbi:hypothetical protein ACQBAU_16375 [Propionibacteriaceae bacterium Y2011]